MTAFLSNRDIYESVICGMVPQERERLCKTITFQVLKA